MDVEMVLTQPILIKFKLNAIETMDKSYCWAIDLQGQQISIIKYTTATRKKMVYSKQNWTYILQLR